MLFRDHGRVATDNTVPSSCHAFEPHGMTTIAGYPPSSAAVTLSSSDQVDPDASALSQLLAALAAGVRSIQSLPIDDDFSFQASFPEFSLPLAKTQSTLLESLSLILESLPESLGIVASSTALLSPNSSNNNKEDSVFDFVDIEDPVLWERCADACDALLDQVEAYLSVAQQQQQQLSVDVAAALDEKTVASLNRWSNQARYRSHKSMGRMLDSLVDLPIKPQDLYHIPVQNSRTEPFVPRVHAQKPHALEPHQERYAPIFVPGHGLDTRLGKLKKSSVVSTFVHQSHASVNSSRSGTTSAMIAPTQHVQHFYEPEIEALEWQEWQLTSLQEPPAVSASNLQQENLQATWVDTLEALQDLQQTLEQPGIREIALDLEAHSFRSFSGLTCLMQLSFYEPGSNNSSSYFADPPALPRNYLIDTLKLHAHLNDALQPILADPDVVKILHGADSDIAWLQRDFGLYIVQLFDTGRAARALQFPSAGYAYLLRHYHNILADKTHQLSDWRQRPLPSSMMQYAIQDTHYLIDIYHRLRWDLHQKDPDLLKQVWDTSKHVSLIRHAVEPFKPDGYKVLLSRRGTRRRSELNELQERVLAALWDWRDATARRHDESVAYVCDNKALVRLALSSRNSVSLRALQSLLHPVPPLVWQYAQDVIELIKQERARATAGNSAANANATDDEEDEEMAQNQRDAKSYQQQQHHHQQQHHVSQGGVGTHTSSAFFKPTGAPVQDGVAGDGRRRGMMSPVLATEALYEQAGWMTPVGGVSCGQSSKARNESMDLVEINSTTTATDDDAPNAGGDPNSNKPKRMLSFHSANKDFQSKPPSQKEESLEYSAESVAPPAESPTCARYTADGMGTVRAARDQSQSPPPMEDEARESERNSARIRAKLSAKGSLPRVLGLITTSGEVGDDDEDNGLGEGEARSGLGGEIDEEDFPIPRSMREIYKISNRNRRNKKAGSPTPERGVTPTSEKEREELAKAEAVIRDRGALAYLDDNTSSPKRPRTKPTSGRESEETVPQDLTVSATSREEDMALIRELGWTRGEEVQPAASGWSEDVGAQASDRTTPAGFDYSTVGAIGALDAAGQAINPFFSGAALTGGPLAQGFAKTDQRPRKATASTSGNKGKPTRRVERPEKKEGRTHSYRKR